MKQNARPDPLQLPSAIGQAAAQAAVSSVITQGIGVATGLQKKFSWTAVAASAVGAGIGRGVSDGLAAAGLGNNLDDVFGIFARETLSSLANGAAQALVSRQQPDWSLIAAQSVTRSLMNAAGSGGGQQGNGERNSESTRGRTAGGDERSMAMVTESTANSTSGAGGNLPSAVRDLAAADIPGVTVTAEAYNRAQGLRYDSLLASGFSDREADKAVQDIRYRFDFTRENRNAASIALGPFGLGQSLLGTASLVANHYLGTPRYNSGTVGQRFFDEQSRQLLLQGHDLLVGFAADHLPSGWVDADEHWLSNAGIMARNGASSWDVTLAAADPLPVIGNLVRAGKDIATGEYVDAGLELLMGGAAVVGVKLGGARSGLTRLSPAELAERAAADEWFVTNSGFKFADGIAFESDIAAHITRLDGFSQSKGIGGAHNLDFFMDSAAKNDVKIISQTPGRVDGISTIKYQVPSVDRAGNLLFDASGGTVYKSMVFEKTVYDPKIISDSAILDLGQRAASSGYANAIKNGERAYSAEAGGVSFRIYLDPKTGLVTNFHPR